MRVDLGIISEDLRQRVLTAIASELERDEAERPRNAREQDGAGDRFGYRVLGTEHAIGVGDAADANDATSANGGAAGAETISGAGPVNGSGVSPESSDISLATSYGVGPANGSSANPENGSAADLDNGSRASLDDAAGAGPGYGIGPVPGNASPWDQELLWPGAPAQQGGTQYGDAADVGRGAADDATAAQEPEEGAQLGDAVDPAAAVDGVAAGRRCRCRGVHLVRTVRRRRPPNCGVSTCRRPCSAAGWTRRSTPSHSPGSPEASPFSRLSGPPRQSPAAPDPAAR